MEFQDGHINGVVIKTLQVIVDERGWLSEIYRIDDAIHHVPMMSYISQTSPGVIRGPHSHLYQTDYFVFIGPGVFKLCLWDTRSESSTWGIRHCISTTKPIRVTVPPGVVHAYKNISSIPGLVINFPNRLFKGYKKQAEIDEIRYENDPDNIFLIPEDAINDYDHA